MSQIDAFQKIVAVAFLGFMLICACGCAGGINTSRLKITYTEQIQQMPDGIDKFWPESDIKKAFFAYWNLRYSDEWKKSYEKEAPYFQEIVSRSHYENMLKGSINNRVDEIQIRSIQKVTDCFYEIQIILKLTTPKKEKSEQFFTDRWVYAGEKWYHVMRDPILFNNAS